MFGVFVKLGVCVFQIYAESYKIVARMSEVFVQLGEYVFQNYAESCLSVVYFGFMLPVVTSQFPTGDISRTLRAFMPEWLELFFCFFLYN